jgi:phosphotransferase system  glucose/maltose/N-acetylglucosamine-specific IIC component
MHSVGKKSTILLYYLYIYIYIFIFFYFIENKLLASQYSRGEKSEKIQTKIFKKEKRKRVIK